MAQKGQYKVTHAAKTTGSAVKHYVGKHFNALLVKHVMSGTTSGGYVSLKQAEDTDATFVAHHGKGTNIKSSATAASYTALFEAVDDYVEVTLNVTDGTHDVTITPVNV